MPSPRTTTGENSFRKLSRVHAAHLAAYATARLELQRPDYLSPRDRAHLAAADALLEEIRCLLQGQREDQSGRAASEQES